MAQSQFDQYLDDLITQRFQQRGYALDPARRQEIKRDTLEELDNFIMSRAIPALSDKDVHRLETLLEETRSVEAAQEFVAAHIPHFTDFLTAVLMEFREVYVRD